MYNDIRTYINTIVTSVNSTITGTDNDLVEIDTLMDNDNLPVPKINNTYLIKLEDFELASDNLSEIIYTANIVIEFNFILANKVANYTTAIDTYLDIFRKYLIAANPYTGSKYKVESFDSLSINKMNNITDGGNYLKPEIKVKARLINIE